MKILYLGDIELEKFTKFLEKYGTVRFISGKLNKQINIKDFDWIISYGYRHIIDSSTLIKTKNPIINLHISFLPYNRGAHPNYWSFKENTPKGVTIHFIDEGIDTGPILVQEKLFFGLSETLESSYIKLKARIEKLFYDNFDDIIKKKILAKPQIHSGTFHKKSDLPIKMSWQTKVKNI